MNISVWFFKRLSFTHWFFYVLHIHPICKAQSSNYSK